MIILQPGFFPQDHLAQRQMKAGGGLLSFVVPGAIPAMRIVIDNFKLIIHAVTFGTSRLICIHPRTSAHEHLTYAGRKRVRIDEGLIRLSVGLEDPKDIIVDLSKALAKL